MDNFSFKKFIPYLTPLVIFVVITLIYFSPVLEGKKLKQDDISRHTGMAKEVTDYREDTGEEALWTNSMFSGMPAYQISVKYKGNLVRYIDDIFKLGLPHPANLVFLYMLGFFILMLALRINLWLGIIGAIAFAFSSYFFIILEAGHNSKAHAIGYMAPVIAGVILTFRGKYILGGILTLLFTALEINAGHPQITYYLFLLLFVLAIFEFTGSVREKKLPDFVKTGLILIIAGFIAVLTNVTSLWATYEYGKYTIRGKSELTTETENRTSGLDKDYATEWSYGVAETFTLLIPNFHGGASYGKLSESSDTYNVLIQNQVPRAQADRIIEQAPTYWGTQPFTSGPVYIGAIVIFLFVLGLIIVPGRLKWWLLTGAILSIMLAWGKNFMPLTEFFLDYVPAYNKFRAVSMTLVIAEIAIPILAFLALQKFLSGEIERQKALKALKLSFYITGGLTLIFALFPSLFFSFTSPGDAQLAQAYPDWLISAFVDDRKNIFQSDSIRSFIFILLTGLLLLGWLYGKVKKPLLFLLIASLVIIDFWPIDKRYLNNEKYINKRKVENPFVMTQADKMILKDKDLHYRVLNMTVDPFADASTSFYHKSIGGYHGAKLRRYQELYYNQVVKGNMEILNMLNAKYIIRAGEDKTPVAVPNMQALGNAWFVDEFIVVENADQELEAMTDLDPSKTAVVDKRFEKYFEGFSVQIDSAASVKLVEYQPNKLVYQTNTGKDHLTVFSEIYYDKGWNAYVDGEPCPHFRVNYVLRAMILPAGKHQLEFRFEPKVYRTGEVISYASSVLLILLVLGGGYMLIRKKPQVEE